MDIKDGFDLQEVLRTVKAENSTAAFFRNIFYAFKLSTALRHSSKYVDKIISPVMDSNGKFFNMYGPTETTVYCNGVQLESSDIHIGKELFNVHEMVMDFDSNPLPPNVIGELYIAGKGVSREYLNRPEKNAEAYEVINGIRFYRSGDFVKVTEEGDYYVFGRMDNQIKLRGLRIEIGEIEVGLSKFPGIKSVAVVVKKINSIEHLCAYFTAVTDIEIDDLKEKLCLLLYTYGKNIFKDICS